MIVTVPQVKTLLETVGLLSSCELTGLVSCQDAERLTGVDRATWFRRLKSGKMKQYVLRGTLCLDVEEIKAKYPGLVKPDAVLPLYKLVS